MTFTFIDTPSHGYLKVPKKKFLELGADKNKISKYSGMSKTLLYLEEDVDFVYFYNFLKNEKGIEMGLNEVHRERSSVPSHNYNPNW